MNPADERSRGGDKGSSAGGEKPSTMPWWKIHITDVWVHHDGSPGVIMYFMLQSISPKKASVLAGEADPLFHLIEILV